MRDKQVKRYWKYFAVCIIIGLLLFSQFGIYLPTDIHEVSDAGRLPGDVTLVEESNVRLVQVIVAQDSRDNTIYVEMGGDAHWQPLDVRRRFRILFGRRATPDDVKVIWYSKEDGKEILDQPDDVNALSARVIISDGKKEIFNHFESFVEKEYTIEGWTILNCDKIGTCKRYI